MIVRLALYHRTKLHIKREALLGQNTHLGTIGYTVYSLGRSQGACLPKPPRKEFRTADWPPQAITLATNGDARKIFR